MSVFSQQKSDKLLTKLLLAKYTVSDVYIIFPFYIKKKINLSDISCSVSCIPHDNLA